MANPKILLVDDDMTFLENFHTLPGAKDFDIIPLSSAEKAMEYLQNNPVDIIVSDVQMREMSGMELFTEVQDRFPDIPFILITAYGSTENAVQAVKKGAYHYFNKPLLNQLDVFWKVIHKALETSVLSRHIAALEAEKRRQAENRPVIIGNSPEIKNLINLINRLADIPATVLITGETGVGKELVAETIHYSSKRSDKPFFKINCHEFADGVMESELFGHEKGAFTGAITEKKGLFELADQGTLFLDEVSEYSESIQIKLLRVLQNCTFKRVGSERILTSDFRLIAATNRDLKKAVEDNRFRQDLYYRLNVITVAVPALRERKSDIILLADYYVKKFSQEYNIPIRGISENAMLTLCAYDWPGNVRELINAVQRAVIVCKQDLITTRDLPFTATENNRPKSMNLKEIEQFYIRTALHQTNNNKAAAAELLGISRPALYGKLDKHGMKSDETEEWKTGDS